jgi:flagellar hook-associated protein 2
MTTFNIGGLVSGIDTNSLIDQLMSAAAAPQTALQTQVTNDQSDIAAYQAVNTKLAAVTTAAQTLSDADTWMATTATSSDSSVVATGSTSAQAGSYTTFSVLKVATAQVSTAAVSGTTIADPTAGIDVVGGDGTTHHIALTDGTPATVAAAINSAGVGVRATVISTDGGQVMQFASSTTGTAAGFTINGLSSTPQTLQAAQNAQISVGDPTAGGYTVSSSTNTFTNAIPGVTFTVSQPATNVTVSVASNETTISNAIQAMVDAVNGGLDEIDTDTAQGAVLNSDSTLETLQQKLLSVISQGTGTGGSFASYGIGLTDTGALTFDPTAFASAYAANPSGTQTDITTLATSYAAVGTGATDPASGSLTQLINTDNDDVTSLNSQIADWTTKLADQKTALQAKYAAMETALATLKSESSFLSSALGGSSSSTSSSSGTSSTSSTSSS